MSSSSARRELAYRVSGGLEVVLYWAVAIGTSVEIRQPATGETIAFVVPPDQALDAFYHPFAYLPMAAGRPEPVAA